MVTGIGLDFFFYVCPSYGNVTPEANKVRRQTVFFLYKKSNNMGRLGLEVIVSLRSNLDAGYKV